MTLEQFLKAVNYRITEGSEYLWKCYGPNCRSIDSWDGNHDSKSFSCYYDTLNQVVYEAQAHDYKNNRSYRWQNPDFKQAHADEAKQRGVDVNQAWDDVKYIDLELREDFLAKAEAIMNDKEYDSRVSVPVDISDSEFTQIAKLAHERDITFNKMVEEILWEAVKNARTEITT